MMLNPTDSPAVDLSKYIEARYFGERPHIRGRRVPVAAIACYSTPKRRSVEEPAYDYTLSEPEVLAALLYYAEHKDEIDAQEVREQAEMDEMYRLYGKK
jgi:uncharacterized protein (DUF433 family)